MDKRRPTGSFEADRHRLGPAMRTSGALAFATAAAALALAATGCVGSNVTLGTPADDPDVPRRAPTAVPRSTPTPAVAPAVPAAAPVSPVEVPPATVPGSSETPSPAVVPSPAAPAPEALRVREQALGDPILVSAPPCASNGIHVRAVVPRPKELDTSYRGALAGIEIRRTIRTGTGGFRHATISGDTVEVDLWARGSGLSAGALGKETCTGGAAADVSFEIVAHYTSPALR